MTEHPFSLIPFHNSNIPKIAIAGKTARQKNILTVHYSLTGKIEAILFPERSAHPTRKDELWTATCFELFLAIKDQPHYWEFNISPSGDWNVYRMDAYRRVGFRRETFIQRLQFETQKEAACFSVDAMVDLSPIVEEDDPMEAGITSVIQTIAGNETYWALTHPNPQADFHLRESFIIEL
ncbi:MAG: DOMON-like domain-containing protein [Chloroflexota bacterium]